MIHVSALVPARTGSKLTLSWLEPVYKENPFDRKILILNSNRMKNNGCRILPCLSAYNHLGRNQITNNSHICCMDEGQPSGTMVVLALSSFKVLTSCRQLQKSNQDFWPFFFLVVRYINKPISCCQVWLAECS